MKNVISIGATNRSLAAVGEAVDRSSFRSVRGDRHDLPVTNMFFDPVAGELHMGVGDGDREVDIEGTILTLRNFAEEFDVMDPDAVNCDALNLDATNRVLEGIGEEVDETSFDDSEGVDFEAFNRVLEAVGESVGPVSFGEIYPVVRLGSFDRDRDLRFAGYARD